MSFAFRWEKHFPNWILFVAPLPPPTIRQSHPCLWGYRSNKFQPLPGSICITFCGTARTALPLTSWNGFANDWKVNFLSSPAGQQLYSTVFLFRGKWLLIRYLAASFLVGGLAGHQFGYLPSGPSKVSTKLVNGLIMIPISDAVHKVEILQIKRYLPLFQAKNVQ